MREQLERLNEELAKTKQENNALLMRQEQQQQQLMLRDRVQRTPEPVSAPGFSEYHEQAIKYKTISEEKEVSLQGEKDRSDALAKELQRSRNELFAVQLEKAKKEKELFTALAQLKELKTAVELEQERRKQLEEDRNHYARIVDINEAKEGGDEDQSLLSAIQELCLLVLSKVRVHAKAE